MKIDTGWAFQQAQEQMADSNPLVRARSSGGDEFANLLARGSLEDQKLKETCYQLEGIFVKQMLTVMRKTIEKSGLIDGGNAEEIFTDMLYGEYANSLGREADFGIAKSLYSQLSNGKKWV